MKTAKQLHEEIIDLSASVEAICAVAESENRELSNDEQVEADKLIARKEAISESELPRAQKFDAIRKEAKARFQASAATRESFGEGVDQAEWKLPASARVQKSKFFARNEDAYLSGQFLAAMGGNQRSRQWCADHGVINIQAAMSEGTNSLGGFTVPDPLSATIINLQEEYGVFQRNTRVLPMTSDTLAFPRLTAGLTVYYPGENTAITASDLTFAQGTLTARKYAALSLMSSELNEDSLIDIAGLVADEMARRFANAIDTNAFTGDGTGTFASVTGFESALHANSRVVSAGGNISFATLDLADFENVVAAVPVLPGAMNKWYISSFGYWKSMGRLMDALGGNAIQDIGSGPVRTFLGYPVEFAQVLQGSGEAVNDFVAYFGDLSLASTMGLRRSINMATSTEVKFVEDQIALRGIARYAITIHEGTAASPVGPVVALRLAAA